MTSSQNDTLQYFNDKFFKTALEHGLKIPNIKIENVTINRAGGGGDNYTSEILKVQVSYKTPSSKSTESISLVVKALHTGEDYAFSKELKLFLKEVNMYQKAIPAIENILNNKVTFAPRFFYASAESEQQAVLQDLTAIGYKLANRFTGLDEDHSRLVLRKIAKMHAGSMVLAKKDPDIMSSFNYGMFCETTFKSKVFKLIFLDHLSHMISFIDKWPDYEEIASKLRRFKENFIENCSKFIKPKETDIKVLNHGDLWVNNLMFKYENEKPVDALFVDLQISFYSTLGIDVQYFLNTSVQLDVLKTKRYELLKEYYHTFKSTLEECQYTPIPTWDQVKNQIRDAELYGFIAFEAVFPLISMDPNESKDNSLELLGDPVRAKEKKDIMFSSEKMTKFMKYSLNRFDELRVFD